MLGMSRPAYFKQVLDSIAACPEHKDYYILISLDGGYDKRCRMLAEEFAVDRKVQIIPNIIRFGINKHNLNALSMACYFGATELVYVEDDTVLSPDALEMSNHFFANNYPAVCLNFFNGYSRIGTPESKNLVYIQTFCPWGFAIKAEDFVTKFKPNWNSNSLGWDFSLCDYVTNNNSHVMIPELSRSHNIGREQGFHMSSDLYDSFFANCAHSTVSKPEQPWVVVA